MSFATTTAIVSLPNVFDRGKMSESGSDPNKAEKKREYNRNAQRVFRQRRKEHLSKLEQAQRELSNLQSEEVERLRRENLALAHENESLKAAYGSTTSSPGASISPTDVRTSSSSIFLSQPGGFGEASTDTTSTSANTTPLMGITHRNPSNLMVVASNNVIEIRQCLHTIFTPLLDVAIMTHPPSHLTALELLQPTLPTALKPTQLQLTTPHHVYIDMLPSPSLRDRLISVGAANSHNFLMSVCTIVCDIEDTGQMTIWGEDWLNEISWEFSSEVLERWGGWLLTPEWGQRANFWRRQRGAPVLPGYV